MPRSGFLLEETEKIREGEWKRRQYKRDTHGRIISMTDSLGHTTSYSYSSMDGHLLKEPSCTEDAMGNQTCYEYDAVGRRICIRTDQGTVEIRYNKQNYPICVVDGNGNELCRTYDRMGNLTAMTPPAQGVNGTCWIYRYDFFDRLVETIDPLGNIWRKEQTSSVKGYRAGRKSVMNTIQTAGSSARSMRTVLLNAAFMMGTGTWSKKSDRRTTTQRRMMVRAVRIPMTAWTV